MVAYAPDKTHPAPKITSWLTVDISSHIDRDGFSTRQGDRHAYGILAGQAEGANIRLRIGTMRAASGNLVLHLTEGGILDAQQIEIEGSDGAGITSLERELTQTLEVWSAAA